MPKVNAKGKKKPVLALKTPEKEQWEIFHAIAFWGLAILLFIPPYLRGLFFQPEQERALIFAAVIFWLAWLWKWSKRDYGFLSHPLDYFALAFPAVYLISAFQAANYSLAVDEVVKTTLYFLVYWVTSRLVRDDKDIVILLHVLYISAIGVALAGLATSSETLIHIKDGFIGGRINSSFQYANALASYLAAVTFIGLYFWRKADLFNTYNDAKAVINSDYKSAWLCSNIYQYLYTVGNFLLVTVFFGAKSHGGFIVFSIIIILFLIGLPKGNRIPVLIHFIFISIPSLIAIWQFLSYVADKKMGLAWLWIFIGLALALTGQVIYSASKKKALLKWIPTNKNIVRVILLLLIIFGCIGAGVFISNHGYVINTLLSLIKFNSFYDRMYFFQDAMKMFKERPILGWGGGGWQEAYRFYQSFMYNSNQVHGHYFQILVEVGSFGFLVILGIWTSFLLTAHRVYHKAKDADQHYCLLVWVLTVVALYIGAHAMIDFNLSLSAISLVLWTILGLIRFSSVSTQKQYDGGRGQNKYIYPNNAILVGVTLVSLTVSFFSGALAFSDVYSRQAVAYLQNQNISQGMYFLTKALTYNPLNAEYHSYLANIYQRAGRIDEAMAEAQKAINLSKYSAPRYANISSLFLGVKKNEEAIFYIEKAMSLAPFQVQWYEIMSRTYFIVGYNELTDGNQEVAKQCFEKATTVPSQIDAKMATLNDIEKKLWVDAPLMTVTPAIKLNVGASQYLLGQWRLAEINLQAAQMDENSKGEASLWLAVLLNKQDRIKEAQDQFEQAQKLVPELAKRYDGLKNLQIIK